MYAVGHLHFSKTNTSNKPAGHLDVPIGMQLHNKVCHPSFGEIIMQGRWQFSIPHTAVKYRVDYMILAVTQAAILVTYPCLPTLPSIQLALGYDYSHEVNH